MFSKRFVFLLCLPAYSWPFLRPRRRLAPPCLPLIALLIVSLGWVGKATGKNDITRASTLNTKRGATAKGGTAAKDGNNGTGGSSKGGKGNGSSAKGDGKGSDKTKAVCKLDNKAKAYPPKSSKTSKNAKGSSKDTDSTKTPKGSKTTKTTRDLTPSRTFEKREVVTIGYHGTTKANGDEYLAATEAGRGLAREESFNGNAVLLGNGLYVASYAETAQVYALSAADKVHANGGEYEPVICVLTVDTSKADSDWVTDYKKIWMPYALLGNGPNRQAKQKTFITNTFGEGSDDTAIRFAKLRTTRPASAAGHQMMIPPATLDRIQAKECIPASRAGSLPKLNYQELQEPWNIYVSDELNCDDIE
ncbi:hypothetical protein BDZ89DRAFT_1062725 [Hymenopellis radicata]|nr:hypothetical protein BDZ89DRAFT_1062725 [Hymenopellis radicata]